MSLLNSLNKNLLTDLIQEFSNISGVSLFLTDKDGRFITNSSFTNKFCQQIQSSAQGRMKCQENWSEVVEFAIRFQKPEITQCHFSLLLLSTPILFDFEVIGAIGACQALTQQLKGEERKKFLRLAKKMKISKPEELVKELNRCKVISGRETKSFIRHMELLGSIISNVVGKEVENQKLTKKLTTMHEELTLLHEVCETIGSALELEEVTGLMLERILEILHSSIGFIVLQNPLTGEMEIVNIKGLNQKESSKIDFSKGAFQNAIQFGTLQLIENTKVDPAFREVSLPVKSLLVVPLKVKGRVIGLCNIGEREGGKPFLESEKKLIMSLATEAAVFIESIKLYGDIHNLFLDTVRALASAIDAKDPYTRGHSDRVTEISVAIAEEMGLSVGEMARVKLCALFHDIGKIGIMDRILSKNGKLEEGEYDEIKKHPTIGAKIIENVKQLQRITQAILHHHERYNGKGYPNGLRGKIIPLPSRIIGVADSFDAMTMERPYRKAKGRREARDEIERCSGTQFDPEVVKAFLRAFDRGKI